MLDVPFKGMGVRGLEPRTVPLWAACSNQLSLTPLYDAGDGSRTRMVSPPRDFKSLASAYFATPAYLVSSYLTLLIYYSTFQKFCQEVLLTFSLLFQLLLTFCIISNFYLFVKNFYFFFSLTNQSLLVRNYLHLTLFSITQVVWNVK